MSLQLNTVGDIIEFKTFCGIQPGQLSINTWHHVIQSVRGTGTDLATLLGIWQLSTGPLLKNVMNPVYTFFGSTAQRLKPTASPFEYDNVTAIGAGGLGAGDIIPFSVAGIISLGTSAIGRANRGRKYISGAGEAENTADAKPSGGYLTQLANLLSQALSQTDTGGVNAVVAVPGVYHRVAGTLTPYAAGYLRPIWGTQRRRGDFGALNTLPWADHV